MGSEDNGLTLETLATKLETQAQRLEALERENERMRFENAELRQEVSVLRSSDTRCKVAESPEARTFVGTARRPPRRSSKVRR